MPSPLDQMEDRQVKTRLGPRDKGQVFDRSTGTFEDLLGILTLASALISRAVDGAPVSREHDEIAGSVVNIALVFCKQQLDCVDRSLRNRPDLTLTAALAETLVVLPTFPAAISRSCLVQLPS